MPVVNTLKTLWTHKEYMAVCQNLVPLVNIKIAGKWMFIPLKMVLIMGIDPYPYKEYISSISIISIQVSTPTFQAQRQPNHWFLALLARSRERKLSSGSSGTQPSKKTVLRRNRLISHGPCNSLQHLPRNCAEQFAKTNCRLIPDSWSFNIWGPADFGNAMNAPLLLFPNKMLLMEIQSPLEITSTWVTLAATGKLDQKTEGICLSFSRLGKNEAPSSSSSRSRQ